MREILFRGKRIDNGEWVYGFLVILANGVCSIIPRDAEQWSISEYNMAFAVIPETVGQYTSLKDKNDNKIFEGDIVKATYRGNYGRYAFVVVFDEGRFALCKNGVAVEMNDGYRPEVIGNIHDNPVLLKDARNGTA